MLSTHNVLCRKFATVRRKMSATFCPFYVYASNVDLPPPDAAEIDEYDVLCYLLNRCQFIRSLRLQRFRPGSQRQHQLRGDYFQSSLTINCNTVAKTKKNRAKQSRK